MYVVQVCALCSALHAFLSLFTIAALSEAATIRVVNHYHLRLASALLHQFDMLTARLHIGPRQACLTVENSCAVLEPCLASAFNSPGLCGVSQSSSFTCCFACRFCYYCHSLFSTQNCVKCCDALAHRYLNLARLAFCVSQVRTTHLATLCDVNQRSMLLMSSNSVHSVCSPKADS